MARQEPENVIRITSYTELEQFARSFADGYFNLLIVIGERGLQKSTTFRQVVQEEACWIEGSASPFVIYLKLHEHRDRPVIIDDVDRLYRSKDGINLLKFLVPQRNSWVESQSVWQRESPSGIWTTKPIRFGVRVLSVVRLHHPFHRRGHWGEPRRMKG